MTKVHRNVPTGFLHFLILFTGLAVVLSFLSIYASWHIHLSGWVPVVIQSKTEPACVQESENSERWIKPPSGFNLHDMSDTELFLRASSVPLVEPYRSKRTPKIAFMFLTRGPLPMAPLWDRFFKGNQKFYSIYIHSSPSYHPDFSPQSAFYHRQIPSQVAEWGMMSMCDAKRRLVASALLDISNEWFLLLSEACIPLQNFGVIYHYLSRSHYSFMGSFDDPGPNGRGRYNKMLHPLVNITNWRKGSQWFEIDRKLAVEIVQDNIYYYKFEQFCRPDCYVDEHYFPTMLGIRFPHFLANRSLTWMDWSSGGQHPATFRRGDINEAFFKTILESEQCMYNDEPASLCFLFARKFASNALHPLLEYSLKFLGF